MGVAMHSLVRWSVVAGVAIAGISALTVAPLAPPSEIHSPRPTAVHEVELAASPAPPPLGAIPLAFIRNQFDYCSVICPDVVRLAITVPAGAALSPAAFVGALRTTGSLTRSIGAAAASVTGPANAATEPIIRNDLNIVLPKAQRALQVALVQGLRVGSTAVQLGDVVGAVQTARIEIVEALNQPKGPPAEPIDAQGVFEVTAVEAVNVFSAVVFQAGELLLLGVVQTADDAAQELARSGDPGAALAAGAATANAIVSEASGLVADAVETATANIRDSFDDPFPSSTNSRLTDPPGAQNVRAVATQEEPKTSDAGSRPDDDDTDKSTESRRVNRESVGKVVRDLHRSITGSSERPRKSLRDNESDSDTSVSDKGDGNDQGDGNGQRDGNGQGDSGDRGGAN